MNDEDDLWIAILLAITEEQVRGLPKNVSIEELARRFPETYRICVDSLKRQNALKTSKSSAKCADSSDGNLSQVE